MHLPKTVTTTQILVGCREIRNPNAKTMLYLITIWQMCMGARIYSYIAVELKPFA